MNDRGRKLFDWVSYHKLEKAVMFIVKCINVLNIDFINCMSES